MKPLLRLATLAASSLCTLSLRADELASVCNREYVLTAAIKSHNLDELRSFTNKDFHLSWSFGSAIRNVRTDVSREEWINGIQALRTEAYTIEIQRIRRSKNRGASPQARPSAYVELVEFWTVRSSESRRIRKRVETQDLWIRQKDGWKLVSRLCQSDFR